MHLLNLLHTMTVYANRWGGPRYRTEEFVKFLHKHLYNAQEEQLKKHEKVNLCLSMDAFLSSRHTPAYVKSVRLDTASQTWLILDELGYQAQFHEGTEVLLYKNDSLVYEKIENVKPRDQRVINFELVEEFKNDKLHHHIKFSENFLSITCNNETEIETMLCDALTSMTIVKRPCLTALEVIKIDQFNIKNIQEIYLVEITDVWQSTKEPKFDIDIMPFSYSLHKNKALSDKSENRYYKSRQSTIAKRYLEKMRSKVFHMKKDNVKVELELKKEEN